MPLGNTYITGVADMTAVLRRLETTYFSGPTAAMRVAAGSEWSRLQKSAMKTRAGKIHDVLKLHAKSFAGVGAKAVAATGAAKDLPLAMVSGAKARKIVRKLQRKLQDASAAAVKVDYQLVFPTAANADAAAALINSGELSADLADSLKAAIADAGISGLVILGVVMDKATASEQTQGSAAAAEEDNTKTTPTAASSNSVARMGVSSVLAVLIGMYAMLF